MPKPTEISKPKPYSPDEIARMRAQIEERGHIFHPIAARWLATLDAQKEKSDPLAEAIKVDAQWWDTVTSRVQADKTVRIELSPDQQTGLSLLANLFAVAMLRYDGTVLEDTVQRETYPCAICQAPIFTEMVCDKCHDEQFTAQLSGTVEIEVPT